MKLDNVNLNLKGNELVLRKTELSETESKMKQLPALYDEHSKKVLLTDVSGSMNSMVARTYTDQYNWPPEVLTQIRLDVQDVIEKQNKIMALMADPDYMLGVLAGTIAPTDLTPDEEELLNLVDPQRGPNGEITFAPSDDELKERVVRFALMTRLGVTVNWSKHTEKPPTRMEIVKRLAAEELKRRFEKYPNSRVAVVAFGTHPITVFDDGTPDELWPALDSLHVDYKGAGGSTDIMSALAKAIEICRANPSKVNIHHFILLTDGEDHHATYEIISWVPNLKASGVILDYIHIGDIAPNPGLKKACQELGGDFAVVNSERELKEKFFEAMNRKMLPAAV